MKKIYVLFVFLFLLLLPNVARAEEIAKEELIIVLDVSNSMNQSDPDKNVIEGVKELIHSLPSNIKVGIITYASNVEDIDNEIDKRSLSSLNSIHYKGYTNTGDALKKAVELLGDTSNGRILLINDGEIILGDIADTGKSVASFEKYSIIASEKKITIDTIFINGELEEINTASLITNGKIYLVGPYNNFSDISKDFIYQNYHITPILLEKKNVTKESQTVSIDLSNMDNARVKVFLKSTVPLKDIKARYNAINPVEYKNDNTYIIEFETLESDNLTIDFKPSSTGIVDISVLNEYEADKNLDYALTYKKNVWNILKKNEAKLAFKILDFEGNNLLNERFFKDMKYKLLINDEEIVSKNENGVITANFKTDNAKDMHVHLVVEDSRAILNDNYYASIVIPKDKSLYGKVVSNLVVMIIILFLYIYIYKYFGSGKGSKNKIDAKGYPFTGKLDIEIVDHKSEFDYPSYTYLLYRAFSRNNLSLEEIFKVCGINMKTKGLSDIYISPSKNGGIYLHNNSDATLIIRRDLVTKGKACICNYGDNIYITLDDKQAEVILHFKNVKSSEV